MHNTQDCGYEVQTKNVPSTVYPFSNWAVTDVVGELIEHYMGQKNLQELNAVV